MLQPKPFINKLAPCVHGGIDYDELRSFGISPEQVIDFSVSCNPYGPPPDIEKAINSASIERYPDSASTELVQALARKLDITSDNLIVGSGSTELIRLIAAAYFGPGDSVLIPQPTYGEYEIACHLVDAHVLNKPVQKGIDFRLDIAETMDMVQKHRPKGIFLCNPNNPTGQYLTSKEIDQIISVAEDCLVVLDEAYIAFTEEPWTSLDLVNHGNLVILRSMTKDYALPGLRLGYAVAAVHIISVLKRVCPPWNVTSVAQKAGVAALNADNYIEECRIKMQEAKNFLMKEMVQFGMLPLPSQTNFFLVEVGDAAEFRQALLRKGILVRDCTSFGLPQYIRLASRTLPECEKLIAAIGDVRILSRAS